jgi:hypothetical protein
MAVVCGLDLHRWQITFDALEVDSGREWRGRIWQPDRDRFRPTPGPSGGGRPRAPSALTVLAPRHSAA